LKQEKESEQEETVYNPKWLQQIVKEKLEKYSTGKAFEMFAKEILKKLGFINVKRSVHGLDFDAEKDGKVYTVEVKGTKTGEDIVIRWNQLKRLWEIEVLVGIHMIMFVNYEGKWCIYQMFDGYMEQSTT